MNSVWTRQQLGVTVDASNNLSTIFINMHNASLSRLGSVDKVINSHLSNTGCLGLIRMKTIHSLSQWLVPGKTHKCSDAIGGHIKPSNRGQQYVKRNQHIIVMYNKYTNYKTKEWVSRVLRPAWHNIGHFGDGLSRQFTTRDVQTADELVRGSRSIGFFLLTRILLSNEICGCGLTQILFCDECIFFLIKFKNR